jgi:quinol monooxygenase YgiN
MIIVMGHAKLAPGEIEKLADAISTQLAATNAEDGCHHYSFARHATEPDTLIVSERWRDQAALDAHFKTPHMAVFNAVLGKSQVLALDIKAYDMDTGEVRQLMGG